MRSFHSFLNSNQAMDYCCQWQTKDIMLECGWWWGVPLEFARKKTRLKLLLAFILRGSIQFGNINKSRENFGCWGRAGQQSSSACSKIIRFSDGSHLGDGLARWSDLSFKANRAFVWRISWVLNKNAVPQHKLGFSDGRKNDFHLGIGGKKNASEWHLNSGSVTKTFNFVTTWSRICHPKQR